VRILGGLPSYRHSVNGSVNRISFRKKNAMNLNHLHGRWLALQIRTRREQVCADILRSKGYEQFLPLCNFDTKPKRSIATIKDRPLFPGYLFCKFNAEAREPISTTPGVIRVLSHGLDPIPVSDEEIDNIRALVNSGYPATPWPFVCAGQVVYLTNGPLRGVQGVLLSVKNSHRLVVSIDLLQRSSVVEIETNWVAWATPVVPSRSVALALPINGAALK
jgi:transcriptional antiterminator NusG